MQWEFNAFSTPLFIAALITSLLALYAWRRREVPGAVPFTFLMLSVAIWSLGYGLEIAAPTFSSKHLAAKVQYFGIVGVPLFWLIYTIQFTGNSAWLSRRKLFLLAIMPTATLLLAWTNEWHGLIWTSLELNTNDPFTDLTIHYGPWFWFNTLYSYLIMFAGTILVIRFFVHSQGLFRRQAGLFLLAAFVPWLGNVGYLFGINPAPDLDLTPFAFTISGLLIAWGFVHFRFLDMVPLARHAIVDKMDDGVFVLDERNRIVDINPAAQALFKGITSDFVGLPAGQIFGEYPDMIERFKDTRDAREVLTVSVCESEKYFELRISPLYDQQAKFTGRLIILQDITEREAAKLGLQKAHNELEDRVQERTIELEAANQKLKIEVAERRTAEDALKYRVGMESLITSISTNFIGMAMDKIDDEINGTLQTIGEYANVDRSYVFMFSEDGQSVSNTHEWCAQGISSQIKSLQVIPSIDYPWWMQRLNQREMIHIPHLSEMSASASAERELLQGQEIQSLLAVPLYDGKRLIGFLGFDSVRQKKVWADEDILMLKLVGEIFVNAFVRKQAEEALRASEAELRALFAAMTDAVIVFDRYGRWLKIAPTNPSSFFLQGPDEEVIGRSLHEILPVEVADTILQQIGQALDTQKTVKVEYSLEDEGEVVWFAGAISPIEDQQVVLVAHDITDRKKFEEQLVYKTLHDVLTGLPNRRLFMERLEFAFERAKRHRGRTFAVLFMDLDRFKVINDSLGHASGDKFLIAITQRLKHCLRSIDTVARFGGDEFAILVDDVKETGEVLQVAGRIQQELSFPFQVDGHEVFTSASIGIAFAVESYRYPEEILRDADAAMYRAKAEGRGRHVIFNADMHAQNLALLRMEADLRRAIEQQEFLVYYQPIIDLISWQVTSVEALLRWQHPQLGMLLPKEFLALAEETRLISTIGEWVLRTVSRQEKIWQDAGHSQLRVAVNISPRQFQELHLLELIPRLLAETGLEPQFLELEVCEESVMKDIDLTVRTLEELDKLGVHISIDDFGTGYSSLSYLKNFPASCLKIDRTFIGDVIQNQSNASIASAIIAMAHTLEITVIAEGVETKEQLDFLLSQKCDKAQGFLFSQPLNSEDLSTFLQNGGVKNNLIDFL